MIHNLDLTMNEDNIRNRRPNVFSLINLNRRSSEKIWWSISKKDKTMKEEAIEKSNNRIDYSKTAIEKQRIICQIRYPYKETCAICLSCVKNTSVTHLPCGHILHTKCLNNMFISNCQTKNSCPHCRSDIIIAPPESIQQPIHHRWRQEEDEEGEITEEGEINEEGEVTEELVELFTDAVSSQDYTWVGSDYHIDYPAIMNADLDLSSISEGSDST